MKIVLFGPQGAGKGVIGAFLSKKYNLPVLGTGNMLREAIKEGTELGKIADKYIHKGDLVPPDVAAKIVEERLQKDDLKNGYILDGFPRNLKQHELLDVLTDADFVLSFAAPRELLIKRLVGRRICKECGAVYNIDPDCGPHPKVEGKCDKCGGELYQRKDDTEEAIKKRLNIYDTETKPLIEKFKDKVQVIDTSGSLEENFERVLAVTER